MVNKNLTKQEILQELEELKECGYNISAFTIIGDAAKTLNGIELNITYNSDQEDKNIDIWVDPKYYDYLVKYEELIEQIADHPCIGLGYQYAESEGSILLHKGITPRPKSKKIHGYNVQIINSDSKSNITNFRVVK